MNACSGRVGWGLPRRSGGEGSRLPVQRARFSPWSANWNLHAASETQPACKFRKKGWAGWAARPQGPFERVLTVNRRGAGNSVRTGWETKTRARQGLPDPRGQWGAGGLSGCSPPRTPDSSPPLPAAQCLRVGLACLHGLSGPLTCWLLVAVGLGGGTQAAWRAGDQSLLGHELVGAVPL